MVYTPFYEVMHPMLGTAFAEAGFVLNEHPAYVQGGLFLWHKHLPDGNSMSVSFQVLTHAIHPDRFHVVLKRSGNQEPVSITLSALLWHDFGLHVLDGVEHWWSFTDQPSLVDALLEVGKLLFGYGIPWLLGDLPSRHLRDG